MQTRYTDGQFPFPNELAHPDKKAKPKWGLSVAKAIWSAAKSSNGPNAFYKRRRAYENALKLALGDQDTSKYKPPLGINPKDKDSEWVRSILWDNKNYASKIVRIVKEKLTSSQYDAVVDTVDPTSINMKENMRGKLRAVMRHQEFLAEMSAFTGQNLMGMSQDDIPLNDEDVDVHMELNEKDKVAVELEDGITYYLDRNNWDQVKEQIDFDLTVFNDAMVCIKSDDDNNAVFERVYPGNGIVPESETPYFLNAPYMGHLIYPTIAELKRMAGGELSPQQIDEIFNSHSIQRGSNQEDSRGEDLDYRDVARTTVLYFRYKTTNEAVYLDYTDSRGNKRFVEKDYDYYKSNKDQEKFRQKHPDKNLIRHPYTQIYEGCWVVGTDYMFKYGPKANTFYTKSRGKLGEPLIGYATVSVDFFEGKSTGLMEHIAPTVHELEILDKRIQKLLATPFPDGVQIDIAALKNLSFKFRGKKIELGDLIEMALQQKVFIIDSSSNSLPFQAGSLYDAVKAVKSPGIGLAELMEAMQQKMFELEDNIGFNRASAARQLHPDQGKAVTQMQMMATDTAMGSFYRADRFLFSELTKCLAGHHLINIKNDKSGKYDPIFGADSTEFIRNADDIDIGITIEARPSEEEWQQFYVELGEAVSRGAITESDRIAIKRFKNLKKAQAYMRSIERKRQAMAMQSKQQEIEGNAAVQRDSNQMAHQNAMVEKNADKELETHQSTLRMREREQDHYFKMEEMDRQAQIDSRHISEEHEDELTEIQKKGEIDIKKEKAKPKPKVVASKS